jgi:hypothetical protein
MAVISLAFPTFAQNSDFNLNLHANSHAPAKDIGLPVSQELRRSRTRTAMRRRQIWGLSSTVRVHSAF